MLSFVALKMVGKPAREGVAVEILQSGGNEQDLRLGFISQINGSPYLVMPLEASHKSYGKSSYLARNYLFINGETNQSHWLLRHDKSLILEMRLLTTGDESATEVNAIFYRFVTADTNGDDKLTEKGKQSLALSSPDGRSFKEVLTGLERSIGQHMVDRDNLLIVYRRLGITYSVKVDLTDFSLSTDKSVPILNEINTN